MLVRIEWSILGTLLYSFFSSARFPSISSISFRSRVQVSSERCLFPLAFATRFATRARTLYTLFLHFLAILDTFISLDGIVSTQEGIVFISCKIKDISYMIISVEWRMQIFVYLQIVHNKKHSRLECFLLCNKHFKGNRIKKKKVSEYKHDKSSYSKTISGIFCREMKVLKCIQCNPKYNKIIKHIEECID